MPRMIYSLQGVQYSSRIADTSYLLVFTAAHVLSESVLSGPEERNGSDDFEHSKQETMIFPVQY
jgi:hypothetical protein